MRKLVNAALAAVSAALTVGFGVAFLARWGVRGVAVAAICGVALMFAARFASGLRRAPRLAAFVGYLLLAAAASLQFAQTLKNDLVWGLVALQLATGAIGLLACVWPRPDAE